MESVLVFPGRQCKADYFEVSVDMSDIFETECAVSASVESRVERKLCVGLSQLRKVARSGLGFGSIFGFERVRVPCSCWCIGAQSYVQCGGGFCLTFRFQ